MHATLVDVVHMYVLMYVYVYIRIYVQAGRPSKVGPVDDHGWPFVYTSLDSEPARAGASPKKYSRYRWTICLKVRTYTSRFMHYHFKGSLDRTVNVSIDRTI